MAVIEKSGLMKYKDKAGNVYLLYPITTTDNVDGLDEALSAQIKTHNESQAAHPYIRGLIPTKISQLDNDSGYLNKHQDISGKLDKPANDATATAGQLLTKTANGQEWKDREKDVFIVTLTGGNKTDKTVAEIKAASDAGKVCLLFGEGFLIPLLSVDDTTATFSRVMPFNNETVDLSITVQNGNSTTSKVVEVPKPVEADGLLMSNGVKGNIYAATAGTDYVTPDGMNSAVAEAKPFIVTFTYNGDYHADKTFAEIKAAYDAGKMCYASFLGNIGLRGVFSNSYVTFNVLSVKGSSESIATSMGFVRIYSDNSIVVNGLQHQPFITASGLLKGDGNGGVSAATAGSDYIASGNIVKQTLVSTETTPTENYAINWVYG